MQAPQGRWEQSDLGLSSTPGRRLHTLDLLHQPLPPRALGGLKKGWPWGLVVACELKGRGPGKRWGERTTRNGWLCAS